MCFWTAFSVDVVVVVVGVVVVVVVVVVNEISGVFWPFFFHTVIIRR